MPKFVVENLHDRSFSLAIEPWAASVVIAPNQNVTFECESLEGIAFAVMGENELSVSVDTEPA